MRKVEKMGIVRAGIDAVPAPGSIAVECMSVEELKERKGSLPHRILLLQDMERIQYCKAEFFPECILGTMVIPDKKELLGPKMELGYYMDGERFLLVGEEAVAVEPLDRLSAHTVEKDASTADVLADFLNMLIEDEVPFLQHMEEKLSQIEEGLLIHIPKDFHQVIIRYRKELLVLHTYYEQLANMADMMENGRGGLVGERERQRFASFGARAQRLHGHVEMLREYVLQIREMYQSQIDMAQTHAMNFLTVVTSLFLPLSLLAGWYGMNFTNMPELRWAYGYPALIALSVLILTVEIRFFKKHRLL